MTFSAHRPADPCIVSYLQVLEKSADTFPGFENAMQGVERSHDAGGGTSYCVEPT